MNCKDVKQNLLESERFDDPSGLPEAVVEHVAECEKCRTLAASLQKVEKMVHDADDVPFPDEAYFDQLPEAVLVKLPPIAESTERAPQKKPGWLQDFFASPFFKPAIGFAAALVLVVVSWQMFDFSGDDTSVSTQSLISEAQVPQTENTGAAADAPQKISNEQEDAPLDSEADFREESQTASPVLAKQTARGVATPNADSIAQTAKLAAKSPAVTTLATQEPPLPIAADVSSAAPSQDIELAYTAQDTLFSLAPQMMSAAPKSAVKISSGQLNEKSRSGRAINFRQRDAFFTNATGSPNANMQELGEKWCSFLLSKPDDARKKIMADEISEGIFKHVDSTKSRQVVEEAIVFFEDAENGFQAALGEQDYRQKLKDLRERLRKFE